MAMIVNKMLRVIPKKHKIKDIDCHAICLNLAETGGELWEKVIYFVNEEENCLDIKYKSRKGKGNLGIEDKSKDFDIWTIENYEGGVDNIYFLNFKEYGLKMPFETINLYGFDELRLRGNHVNLKQDFYPMFFHFNNDKAPYQLENVLKNCKDDYVSFDVNGIYSAGTIYSVGEEFSRIPELQTKEEFHKPRSVSYWEANFLILNYELNKLIQEAVNNKFSSIEWDKSNLSEIQFCYKKRIVKKIEIGERWKFFNAEFFDNTVEKKLDRLLFIVEKRINLIENSDEENVYPSLQAKIGNDGYAEALSDIVINYVRITVR
ncbi:hypothetical protein [Lewinella sp. 4G2]|uniref:hypothetical protein n=1 Tax=Lewinella sp. 4G2 TaxID=1803372 RepID=UPI0007B49455|nr:hypothetical protein [Lewinella sp. 4G2]OAV45132.1 hypothetical protein A3850_011805 [Lewinella sp. 4G2]